MFLTDNTTKKVGFWKETHNMGWFPGQHRFSSIPIPNSASSDQIVFLKKLAIVEKKAQSTYYLGASECRICKKPNCSREFTYKGFVWPEGYVHYLRDHAVAVDPDFKRMVEAD